MLYIELDAKIPEFLIVKLPAIIIDDDPREIESIDNQLPHELSDPHLSDQGHQLSFHPFGEVINGYE